MVNSLHLSVLYVLLRLLRCIQASSDAFLGSTDPSQYMWYDATDDCRNTSLPCFTTFKYCSNRDDGALEFKCASSAKKSDMSWADSQLRYFSNWIDRSIDRGPIPLLYTPAWVVLKWANTNPKYPTIITWKPGTDMDINYFSMYKLIPAGQTQWNLTLDNVFSTMLPSNFVPANASQAEKYLYSADYKLKDQLLRSASSAFPVFFTIGQPDDPKYDDYHNLQEKQINATDSTSGFLYPSWLAYDLYSGQMSAREYAAYQTPKINKKWTKWAIGVGVGVGLGVPLLMVLTFNLGKRSGMKSKYNMPEKPGESAKGQ